MVLVLKTNDYVAKRHVCSLLEGLISAAATVLRIYGLVVYNAWSEMQMPVLNSRVLCYYFKAYVFHYTFAALENRENGPWMICQSGVLVVVHLWLQHTGQFS
jgi:hypothetical protein